MTKKDLIKLSNEYDYHKKVDLYTCEAQVIYLKNGLIVLKSYDTVVCCYYRDSMVVFDNYSKTTNSTHVPKFFKWLNGNNHAVYRVVYCYLRSDKTCIYYNTLDNYTPALKYSKDLTINDIDMIINSL